MAARFEDNAVNLLNVDKNFKEKNIKFLERLELNIPLNYEQKLSGEIRQEFKAFMFEKVQRIACL